MHIFYKIYLQWIYWTLFFIARCSTIFAIELPKHLNNNKIVKVNKLEYTSVNIILEG
jgi:hypothetical protein